MTRLARNRRRILPILGVTLSLALVPGWLLGRWLGRLSRSAREQRLAVEAIQATGGSAEYTWNWHRPPRWPRWLIRAVGPDHLSHVIGVRWPVGGRFDGRVLDRVNQLSHLEGISLNGLAGLTDADLLRLSNLRRVKWVDLSHSGIEGPGLAALRGFSSLERLTIRGVPIRDEDLALLKDLRSLKHLDLRAANLTDAGLASLSGLVGLEQLNIPDGPITSRGLVHLRGLDRLRFLGLTDTRVASLEPIRGLRALRGLTLTRTPLDDAGLAHVAGLPACRDLILVHTRITDAGLAHLHDLPSCLALDVSHTEVTAAGVAAFRARLPWILVAFTDRTADRRPGPEPAEDAVTSK